ncbi:zinc-binding dehydrogenase [Streptomyces yangpuensis]|uniref:zinc-binding dehydrogenase n=1 Tax=Streptomyces yangpuensis TaxID=1648182 RepID=UPI0037FB5A10
MRGRPVDEPVDRAATDLAAAEPFDVVLDTVGGEAQHASWHLLRPGGTLITLSGPVEEAYRLPGASARRVVVAPDGDAPRRIGALIDAGTVRVEVRPPFPCARPPRPIGSAGRAGARKAGTQPLNGTGAHQD